MDYLTTHTSLSRIRRGFEPNFVNYKKEGTRLATVSDKVDQLLAHGRWFSPGTPASSTTKTGRHDIAEIFLKVALNTINQSSIIILLNVHREVCRITRKKTHLSTINNVHLTVAYPVYKSEGLLQPPRSRHPSSRVAAHSNYKHLRSFKCRSEAHRGNPKTNL